MFTTDAIAALIPVVPRLVGHQPVDVLTLTAIADDGVLSGSASWRDQDGLDGQTVHQIMRRLQAGEPQRRPLMAGLAVLWSDTDDSTDLDWLALEVATAAQPDAVPVTVVQAGTDATRWRAAAQGWQSTDPTSAAMAAVVAAGHAPVSGGLAERLATWRHDPVLAAAVAENPGPASWVGPTVEARRSIVDDVWAAMVAANGEPEQRPDALGMVLAAMCGPVWLRDTLMLRAGHYWLDVCATLAAAVRAATDAQVPDTAATTAAAAFAAGDELSGREALIRAVNANPAHSLTALLDRAESVGMPMTRTCRDTLGTMPEQTTLSAGLE